jgi:hypothetical protein
LASRRQGNFGAPFWQISTSGIRSTGYVAVGQSAFGVYVLAKKGIGQYVWDAGGMSPIARQFFESLTP